MSYINTTFAHGNGPYARCTEWAVSVNDVREERDLDRLPIVVPLVYPGRQERIMREELGDFLGTIIAGIYEGINNGDFNCSSDFEKAVGRPHKSAMEIIREFNMKLS